MSTEIFRTCISVETKQQEEMPITVARNPSGTRIGPRDCNRAKNEEEWRQKQQVLAPKKEHRGCFLLKQAVLSLGQSPACRGGQRIICSPSDTNEWSDLLQLQKKVLEATLDDLTPNIHDVRTPGRLCRRRR